MILFLCVYAKEMGNCLKCFKSSENSVNNVSGVETSITAGHQNSERIRGECNERGGN